MKKQDAFAWAQTARQAADEKLGQDILGLDVRRLTSLVDCFLFVTGTSHVHIRALEDAVRESLKSAGAELRRTDGQRGHLWRALDYGSLIVHIMDQKTRDFYSIERLWAQGKPIVFSKAALPTPKSSVSRKKKAGSKKKTKK